MRRLLCFVMLFMLVGCNPAVPQAPEPGEAAGPQDVQTDHLLLGNPSGARNDPALIDNFLLSRAEYALAYDRDAGIPVWVSWHLDEADLGAAERSEFRPDPNLPQSWYQVTPRDYTGSGYDRGHMIPSADRTASQALNETTFFMTNVVPQAPDNNQGPWVELENHSRELVREGNELYIIAGPHGSQGSLANGKVQIPEYTWKVVVVLPEGSNDLQRINAQTDVIAILMPNQQGIRNRSWRDFNTSVDAIESLTGLDLLAALPDAVEARLEAGNGPDTAAPVGQASNDGCGLIFSEYVEGSSNNKAFELFNGSATPLDLSAYRVELYSNGAAAASSGVDLEGILEPGGTLVIINSGADPQLLPKGNLESGVANFNGNDALVLLRNNAVVDVIGQVGYDPGEAWTANGIATQDQTLRRQQHVRSGATRAGARFDVAAEWQASPIDEFSNLGQHQNACR